MYTNTVLVLVIATLCGNAVFSLPAVNFTDSAVPGEMMKTFGESFRNEQPHADLVDPRGLFYTTDMT